MGPFVRAVALRTAIGSMAVSTSVSGDGYRDLRGKLPQRGEYPTRSMDRVDGIVIHHSATRGQSLRSMAEFHVEQRGWNGIGYHYAVGWDGTIFHLNDAERLTNHTAGANSRNIGVVMVGNLHDNPVPQAQRDAVRNLVYYLREVHAIHRVQPHRAFKSTACPGDFAVDQLSTLWVDG
jgi:hypothetical protein